MHRSQCLLLAGAWTGKGRHGDRHAVSLHEDGRAGLVGEVFALRGRGAQDLVSLVVPRHDGNLRGGPAPVAIAHVDRLLLHGPGTVAVPGRDDLVPARQRVARRRAGEATADAAAAGAGAPRQRQARK